MEQSLKRNADEEKLKEELQLEKKYKTEEQQERLLKYRIKDGKKILILGSVEVSAEEFVRMAEDLMTPQDREELNNGKLPVLGSETFQLIN